MDVTSHKVVVGGGGGSIGSHLAKQLLQDGVNVIRAVGIKSRSNRYQVQSKVENDYRVSDNTPSQARLGVKGSIWLKDNLHKTCGWIEFQSEAFACV